jgi:hypothetical protein
MERMFLFSKSVWAESLRATLLFFPFLLFPFFFSPAQLPRAAQPASLFLSPAQPNYPGLPSPCEAQPQPMTARVEVVLLLETANQRLAHRELIPNQNLFQSRIKANSRSNPKLTMDRDFVAQCLDLKLHINS